MLSGSKQLQNGSLSLLIPNSARHGCVVCSVYFLRLLRSLDIAHPHGRPCLVRFSFHFVRTHTSTHLECIIWCAPRVCPVLTHDQRDAGLGPFHFARSLFPRHYSCYSAYFLVGLDRTWRVCSSGLSRRLRLRWRWSPGRWLRTAGLTSCEY